MIKLLNIQKIAILLIGLTLIHGDGILEYLILEVQWK